MSLPKIANEPRPVQVLWGQTSVLVEYVPANFERPRAKKAEGRAEKAQAAGDLQQELIAAIDWLAEVLTGWSHRDGNGNPIKVTRAALGRQPAGWIGAALTAVGADMVEYDKELKECL